MEVHVWGGGVQRANVFTPDQGLSLILGPIQDRSLALLDMHAYTHLCY